jgi:hypothetical protein
LIMGHHDTAIAMIDDVADALRERDEEPQAQALQGCCDALYAAGNPLPDMDASTPYRRVFDAVSALAVRHGFALDAPTSRPTLDEEGEAEACVRAEKSLKNALELVAKGDVPNGAFEIVCALEVLMPKVSGYEDAGWTLARIVKDKLGKLR